jgi:Family of unknown function (DUF5681)
MSGKSGSSKTRNPGWFSKGSSPNPGGRPAASPAPQSSAFEVLVEKTLTVTDRTGTREITIEEALQRQTYGVRNLARTGHNSSLSHGRFKRPSSADGAVNA